MRVFIGDQSLAFDPRNVLAPRPQQPRGASGSHVSNLQIDDRKIRSAGGGAAGLAQPIRRGKHTFGREKSCGITLSAALRGARAPPERCESRTVSGHGRERLRRAHAVRRDRSNFRMLVGAAAEMEIKGAPAKPPRRRGSLTSSGALAPEGCWNLAKLAGRSFDLDQVRLKFPPPRQDGTDRATEPAVRGMKAGGERRRVCNRDVRQGHATAHVLRRNMR